MSICNITLLAGLLALSLVELTGLDGERVDINPNTVVQLHTPPTPRQGQFHEKARCIIYTDDGKFISVLQKCQVVRKLLNDAQ